MRVWILRFTNGPAMSGGHYMKERYDLQILGAPRQCYPNSGLQVIVAEW